MRQILRKQWPVEGDNGDYLKALIVVEQDDEGRYWLETSLYGDGVCRSQLANGPDLGGFNDQFLGDDLSCGYVPGSGDEGLEQELAEELGTCIVEGTFRFNS